MTIKKSTQPFKAAFFLFILCFIVPHSTIYAFGTVKSVKGDVITLDRETREKRYLKNGDELPRKVSLITKAKSSLIISFSKGDYLLVGEKTQLTILQKKNQYKKMAFLLKGTVVYKNPSNYEPSFYITNKKAAAYYTSNSYSFSSTKQNYRFRKKGSDQIVSIAKKGIPLSQSQKNEDAQIADLQTDAVAEASSIFSDTADSGALTPKAEIDSIFGDTSAAETEKVSSEVTQEIDKEKKKERSYSLDLYSKSTFYGSKPPTGTGNGNVDSQNLHQDLRLTVSDKYVLDDASNFNYSAWLEISNRKHIYNDVKFPQNFQNSQRDYFYINEIYYTYNSKKYDIQVGKKVVKLGKGIIYSPTDSITATDVMVPTSPLLIGNYVMSLDYYIKDWTFSAIFFPLISPNKSATQNSRWTLIYDDINYQLEQDLPQGFGAKSKQILLKLEGTKYNTDWMFTFFNGPNPNPVLRTDIVVTNNEPSFSLVQEFVPITMVSAGFSTVFAGWEFHGEFLMQNAEDGKDDSFFAQMLGFRYVMDEWPKALGLNNIDFILEHGKETMRDRFSAPFYNFSSILARPYQNSLVGTMIFNLTDRTSINYDFHFDLQNSGNAQLLSYNYVAASGNTYRFKVETYQGEPESNFGIWKNNDNVSFEYNYSF